MLAGRGRVIFLRSLATMLGVGIPLARALAMLAEQREGNQLSQASLTVLREVEQGRPLSEGMKACGTGCFTPFQLQLVRVGEKSGSLLAVLDELAKHEEQSRALTLKVRSALTYPLVMFVVCTLLLLIVPPLMVQGPLRALTEMGGDTPLLTRVVMGVTGFMVTPLGMLLLLLGLGASLVSLWQALRRPESRLWLHRRLLGLGPVGHGLRMLALARFSRSLAVMVRTGVQLLHALPLALATTADPVLLEQTSQTMRAMQDGADLSEALALGGYFPRGFVSVLRSAEETGRLERTLHWVAGIYELELESSLEMACAMIEPILMLGMGITAGVIALAVMLPLVKLVQAL
jgi:type II secretory pathway component PulF